MSPKKKRRTRKKSEQALTGAARSELKKVYLDRASGEAEVEIAFGDVYDKLLDGRTATIERIYRDYEDAVHIAVTVDGSAEQELFRETGRYLFFTADELEVS